MAQVRELTYMRFEVDIDYPERSHFAGLATARGETNAELIDSILVRGFNELMSQYSEKDG